MKEDDPIWRQFRKPRREVMLYSVVGMKSVDMQKINRIIVKLAQGIIKKTTMEPDVQPLIVFGDDLTYPLYNFFAIETGMLFAFPGVNRMQGGAESRVLNGLAEGEERDAVMCAKFGDEIRATIEHQVVREPSVTGPWTGATFRIGQVRLELRRAKAPLS